MIAEKGHRHDRSALRADAERLEDLVQAGLAVGKQEKKPMDEQARKIMFGVDKPAHAQQQ